MPNNEFEDNDSKLQFRKKTEVPEQQKEDDDDDDDEPVDFASKLSKEEAEEYERFFADASMDDLREMADILGVTYQDHCAATELKLYPDPEPQESDVEAVVRRAEEADPQLVAVNFNNIKAGVAWFTNIIVLYMYSNSNSSNSNSSNSNKSKKL